MSVVDRLRRIPLVARLLHRDALRIVGASELFDRHWYLERYPDVAQSGLDPLLHYVVWGATERREPGPGFDTAWYLACNPEVMREGINPLVHYLRRGRAEGPLPQPAGEPVSRGSQRPPRFLAWYLPQYHPIPENDLFWGEGFTDWRNVARGRPLFTGHEQPHVPGELGQYDLRRPEIRARQAELARAYGIDGFVYHYYWFGGRKLLETPLESMVASGEPDFPFCLSWSNENWTRRWDGRESEILIAQHHTLASDCAFFREVVPILKDPRYITCDGRPVLIVYRPELMRNAAETSTAWRDEADRAGLPGLHLCAVHWDTHDPRPIGFDALIEFPPHHFPAVPWRRPLDLPVDFEGTVLDFESGISLAPSERPFTYYPGVMTAWDNTARRGTRATIFHGATPERYEQWLRQASLRACRTTPSDDHFVFINAWNEWAEGAHLEPDERHGLAFLEATKRVADTIRMPRPARKSGARPVLFVSHDAHQAGAQLLLLHLVRTFAASEDIEPMVVLCAGGRLEPEFAKVAPTFHLSALDVLPWRPAVAFCNTVASSRVAETLARQGIPVVSLVLELPTSIRAIGEDTVPRLMQHSRRVLVVSRFVRDQLAATYRLDASRLEVTHLSLARSIRLEKREASRREVRRELGLPRDAFLVLGCGSVHPRKGTDLFIQVARAARGGTMRFVWIGEDQEGPAFRNWCQHDIESAGLVGEVILAGGRAETEPYFLAADAFALTSREDPFPLVNLEAMAAGLPVVAFEGAGGAPEALDSGAGILVPYLDCAAMASELVRLATDPSRAASLGDAARARVEERYRWDRFVADIRRALAST